jgi:hypothetical protein
MALRQVRAWLAPWIWVWRYWQAWTRVAPPPELQHLLDAVGRGSALNWYNSS